MPCRDFLWKSSYYLHTPKSSMTPKDVTPGDCEYGNHHGFEFQPSVIDILIPPPNNRRVRVRVTPVFMPNQQMASSCIICEIQISKTQLHFTTATTYISSSFLPYFDPTINVKLVSEDRFSGGNNVGIFAPSFTAVEEPFVSLFRDLRHFLWVGLGAGGVSGRCWLKTSVFLLTSIGLFLWWICDTSIIMILWWWWWWWWWS